jgi:hypothetical protein
MAKPNYDRVKRQKEMLRKQKKQEKILRKQARATEGVPGETPPGDAPVGELGGGEAGEPFATAIEVPAPKLEP